MKPKKHHIVKVANASYDKEEVENLLTQIKTLSAKLEALEKNQRARQSFIKVIDYPIIENIPDIFSLHPVGDYISLMSKVGKVNNSTEAWQRTAEQMRSAVTKFQVKNDSKRSKFNAA